MYDNKSKRCEIGLYQGCENKPGLLLAALENSLDRYGSDVTMFDPFVKLHNVAGNDNEAIDFVASLLTDLAIRRDMAPFDKSTYAKRN
jgi:hypothetical protein